MKPSIDEAYGAIPDLLYVIDQCLAYSIWTKIVKPKIENSTELKDDREMLGIINNSILESSLMFIRKLNEFFGKKEQGPSDEALRAYHFGEFTNNGWFLTESEYNELHMRVGHISVEEVRHGKKLWPIDEYLRKGLLKAYSFLVFISESPKINEQYKQQIESKIELIKPIIDLGDEK
jgi:hypothetical protein